MARFAEGEDYLVKYLSKIPNDYKCSVGLILGQISSQKYHVIHLAITPPFQDNENEESEKPVQAMKTISEINDSWVADHARQTTRMLPGGLHVLGLFVVIDEDILNPLHSKLRSILATVNTTLNQQNYLFGHCSNEKLILHYSGKTKRYQAKIYDVVSLNIKPVDFKIIQKSNKWMSFDCAYEIDHICYLNDTEGSLNKHVKIILDNINSKLSTGVLLFDNEYIDMEDRIENISKKKKSVRDSSNKNGDNSVQVNKPVKVTILEETELYKLPETVDVLNVSGQIRFVGQVFSKTWFNPKTSISEVVQGIKEDIMRSLASRVSMHWDSLTEEELGEATNCVHEPPRRVVITLPESNFPVSDYLFPGEGPEDVEESLEELLGIKKNGDLVLLDFLDIEGQIDTSQYSFESKSGNSENQDILPQMGTDPNKLKFLLGLGGALLVLIISIIVHFTM